MVEESETEYIMILIFYFQYWPSRGTETYGVMCVTLTDTQELATYVIRTLQLQRVSSAHVRHPCSTHSTHSHWQTGIILHSTVFNEWCWQTFRNISENNAFNVLSISSLTSFLNVAQKMLSKRFIFLFVRSLSWILFSYHVQ